MNKDEQLRVLFMKKLELMKEYYQLTLRQKEVIGKPELLPELEDILDQKDRVINLIDELGKDINAKSKSLYKEKEGINKTEHFRQEFENLAEKALEVEQQCGRKINNYTGELKNGLELIRKKKSAFNSYYEQVKQHGGIFLDKKK